jgi:calcineurin-like phosphoesterase family protein
VSIFFSSDHHFGHKNIISYCDRPFHSVDQMEDVLIRNWNERVRPQDTVYHLGDFAFAKRSKVEWLLSVLNGTKYLIKGNHDGSVVTKAEGWERVWESNWLSSYPSLLMTHRPYDLGRPSPQTYNLHGHLHSKPLFRRQGLCLDVGVDAWNYAPVSLDEVVKEFER